MPYEITWYIEERVLNMSISGNIELEEFERMHKESFALVEKSPYTVHAIVDLSEFDAAPTNLRMMSSASNSNKSDKQGMTVMVMPKIHGMFRFVTSVIMQTLRLEYRICQTQDDAIEILRRIDNDLRDLMSSDAKLT